MSGEFEYEPLNFEKPDKVKIDYRAELNEQQYAAVVAGPGPAVIIAGAGSGKTRTLTYRVAYLIEQGYSPDNILLLTFTNKAANEMMSRASRLIKYQLHSLWGGTFHSTGARILRKHASLIGYRNDFTILDTDDAESVLKRCIEESGINLKKDKFPKASVLAEIFSKTINTCKPLEEIVDSEYSYFQDLTDKIAKIYRIYQERKLSNNVMDFDDLLILWYKLLQKNPDLLSYYQSKFKFILVDEYQDTNKLQADIVDLLAQKHRNLMVVGDDAQSIYSWRGANFRNILDFPERYPDAKIFKIEYNYRSTPQILALANAIIESNIDQFHKRLKAVRGNGDKPMIIACDTAVDQAIWVADRIKQLYEEGISYSNIAVLYRSHFHSMDLQMELTNQRIPFEILSGLRYYEQAHIKDVTAFMRVVCNPDDETSFYRVIKMLPGVGEKSAEKIWHQFKEAILKSADTTTRISNALKSCKIPPKIANKWKDLGELFSQLEKEEFISAPGKMIMTILNSIYNEYLRENYTNYQNRIDDIEQLASFAEEFTDAQEFLARIALLTNLDAETEAAGAAGYDRVRLSTVHQAKGLEFDVVFVIMLCEGLFPNERASRTKEGLEEERRLFYVAVTRAKNQLYLLYPNFRKTAWSRDAEYLLPSSFLTDLPPKLYVGLKVKRQL